MSLDRLQNIRVAMVETSHSGNIGACARALKTMGLSKLALVKPRCRLDEQAFAMASGAIEVLDHASRHASLADALAGSTLVIGASARSRSLEWPMLSPDEMAAKALAHQGSEVIILLGRESSGLTNDELAQCHFHVHIPANPDYSSLNVAAAAQILAWSCRRQALLELPVPEHKPAEPLASGEQLQGFFQHLEQMLVDIGFLDPNNPRYLMARLRRLFMRARPEENEINILRGVLTEAQKKAGGQR